LEGNEQVLAFQQQTAAVKPMFSDVGFTQFLSSLDEESLTIK